jgi:amidase
MRAGATAATIRRMDTDLAYSGVAGQLAALRAGEITAAALLDSQLERIAALDPRLRAFRLIDEQGARAAASAADAARSRGEERALLGVPLALKDNADAEGLPTRHGLAGDPPAATADAELVARLRAAGAVFVGKTNLPELAMWPLSLAAPERRSANPWDTNRSPGGSSSGSAAAVAAGLVAGATATDGGGSIRVPAALCGLVGLKTTRGAVSLAPVDPHWHGATSAGVLTRTVEDSALLLDAIADQPLAGDLPARVRREPGRLKVAVSVKSSLPPARPDGNARAAVDRTVELLRELGHEAVEVKPPYGMLLGALLPAYTNGVAQEAATLPRQLTLERRSRQLAAFGRRYDERALRRTGEKAERAYERLVAAWEGADAFLTPAVAKTAPRLTAMQRGGALGTFLRVNPWVAYTPVWNWTGQPALVVPAGRDDAGLPRGVQLVGKRGDDALLLQLGAQLERARPWAAERPPL